MWGSDGLAAVITGDQTVVVLYDLEGEAVGFSVDGTVYTYVKNLQGDVIRVLDGDGNVAVQYTYDPWGVPTVTGSQTIAAINPCSYRGYYYDQETGYYYLQSRYYDPEMGRFLNADDVDVILGVCDYPLEANLFAYCQNAPVFKKDPKGLGPIYFVGCGIQIEFLLGRVSFGVEIVWYFSSRVNVQGRNRLNPYLYFYGSFTLAKSETDIIQQIIKNPSKLLSPGRITSNRSFSVSIFAIFGYSTFRNPDLYLGGFSSTSITAGHIKAYTSFGSSCFTVGAGWSTSWAGASVTYSHYLYWNVVFQGLVNLYNIVLNAAKKL